MKPIIDDYFVFAGFVVVFFFSNPIIIFFVGDEYHATFQLTFLLGVSYVLHDV